MADCLVQAYCKVLVMMACTSVVGFMRQRGSSRKEDVIVAIVIEVCYGGCVDVGEAGQTHVGERWYLSDAKHRPEVVVEHLP